jgi:sterol desaturase/sphingolipid hydroxylase (fatty acid hydroxylase superfamily)
VLSRRAYYADFLTVPLATSIAIFWLFSLHQVRPEVFASSIMVGAALWTLIEYLAHRWVLHAFASREHRFHHIYPAAFIGVSPLGTAGIGAIGFFLLTCLFGAVIGVGLLVGLVSGYLLYVHVHDRIHHGDYRDGTYMGYLRALHDWHHKRFRVNYGVVTPIWDILFGTYQAPTRR